MSKFINKVVTGVSSVAMAAMMFAPQFATNVSAATAGEVYKTTDGTVWFITTDMKRRPFTSWGAFQSYGFLSAAQVKTADAAVSALPTGDFIAPQDGRIFCATATKGSDVNGECALITGGKKAAFTSSSVFSGQGFSFSRAFYGDSSFLMKTTDVSSATAQHLPGTLINNGGTIQLVVSGGLWGTPSMDVFNSWGWAMADVVPSNAADVTLSQTGVIKARMAGQLSPEATTGEPTPGTSASCDDLSGDAGSVDSYDLVSNLSDEEVGEDEEDVPVAGLEIEADDSSDLCITAVRLVFNEGTAGSDFEDYASEVSLWLGDEEVGRVDADTFNDNNDWTATVSLDGAVIGAGDTEELKVAVSGINNLDSGDAVDTWTVDFRQVRFQDGDGATVSEDPTTGTVTFSFELFATAANTEFKISNGEMDDEVNDAHVINIDATDETSDESILSFNVEIEGDSDVNLDAMPVTITVANQDNVDEMISGLSLWLDDEEVGTASIGSDCLTDADCVSVGTTEDYLFDNMDLDLSAGEEYEFLVKVDIYGITDTGDVAAGDTISAAFGETETDNAEFKAEDESGEDLADADKTGTVTGSASEVRDIGFQAAFVSSDASVDTGEVLVISDVGTFEIVFDVTPFDGDIYIDKTGPTTAGGATESDVNQLVATGTVSCVIDGVSNFTTATNSYKVLEGRTGRFRITCDVRDGATDLADGFNNISLGSILYALTDVDGDLVYNFDLTDYKTPTVYLDDQGF